MKKRNKKNRSKDKQTQSKKREVRVKSPEDRFLWKLVGVALLAFSAFVATALASYDWRSVASLNPKPTETTNLVGVIGNAFAYGVFCLLDSLDGASQWHHSLGLLSSSNRFRRRSRKSQMGESV